MSTIGITRGEKTISGALALGMHLLFALLLVFGVAWQQRRTTAPVTVELWSNLPPQPKVETPPPEVKPELEPPQPPPPKMVEPKAEPKPLPKPDIALKEKAEQERKRREEEERRLKEEEKLKAEAKKREEERKRLAMLKEQQAKEARQARERDEAMRRLAEKQAAEQANARQRLIDDYRRRISDKIRRYVVLPPNLQGNPEAEFDVVQIPGGEVLSVKLKRSSGNSAYDAAVERAIHKAQPLPPPPEGFTFGEFRELSLRFRPKE